MSQSARIVNFLLRTLKFNKMFLDMEDSVGDRKKFEQIVIRARSKENRNSPPAKLFKHYVISRIVIDNHTTHLIKQKKGINKKIAIYFHGGGYVKGPLALQWKTLAEIADATMYDVAILNYPKTPEYTCQETINYCVQVFEKILLDYGQTNIIFLGDSAGGGLALSLFMSLRDLGKATPEKMILMSPWLDVSMTNKEIPEYKDKDLILTVDGLIVCGLFYAGGIDTGDWRVSPMYGDLDCLPETHVFVGGSELFYPDCRDFIKNAKAKGYVAELHYYEDMQHDWPIIPLISEAKQARAEIIGLIQE